MIPKISLPKITPPKVSLPKIVIKIPLVRNIAVKSFVRGMEPYDKITLRAATEHTNKTQAFVSKYLKKNGWWK